MDKCIRNTSTWSYIEKNQKFDSSSFRKLSITSKLREYSPKMAELIKQIQELDKKDLEQHKTTFKHVIYSDVQGIYGSKMVAAVLLAHNFKLCYDKNFKLVKGDFALLSSSVVYSKPIPVKLKKDILTVFNARPDNVYGKSIRIIIIDSGYKEGIDLFDVKYFHVLEPLVTKMEETQVLGRALRFCGQSGLPFNQEYGWKLFVNQYNMKYNNDMDVFELYLKHSGIVLNNLNLSADFNSILQYCAIDKSLTSNLTNNENRFKDLFKKIDNDKQSVSIYGKIYHNNVPINCPQKCHGPLQGTPNGLLLIAALMCKYKYFYLMNDKYPKNILCNKIVSDRDLCKYANELWMRPTLFITKNGNYIIETLEKMKIDKEINNKNYEDIVEYFNMYLNVTLFNQNNILKPPKEHLSFLDFQFYIKKYFKKFMWKKTEFKNLCEKVVDDDDDIKFTPSQDFIRHYFTPANIYKGLLINHSVGTGKTCTAIATASNFQREGYTIIWVTRHTLKQDIWKNMFDKVCNTVLQENLKKGWKMPTLMKDKMKLISDNWFPVLSYKQFTNLINRKNEYYKKLISINGSEDPFKKTLIIIDEVHKIFSNQLKKLEQPDVILLKKALHKSYSLSLKDSCRLLLLSATPLTDDIMSLNKTLNLIINEQLPENKEEFIQKYCDTNGYFTVEGAIDYINKTTGVISYLNRESDARQFAYPVIKNIITEPIPKKNYREKLRILENNYATNKTKELRSKIKQMKDKIKDDHSVLSELEKCLD